MDRPWGAWQADPRDGTSPAARRPRTAAPGFRGLLRGHRR